MALNALQNSFESLSRVSAVAMGGSGSPLMAVSAPPFWFTKNTAFETSRNDKTTDNDGKTSRSKHYSRLTFSQFFAK